jgi:hypothetical protein
MVKLLEGGPVDVDDVTKVPGLTVYAVLVT